MPDLSALLQHWRYPAIFIVVILGNVGLPVPEETVLALGGFLAERGVLQVPMAIVVGLLAAILGDNMGFWLGRRYGRDALERYGRHIGITPERLAKVSAFVGRYGGFAIFGARFLPGARSMAGPVAGVVGIAPRTFIFANTFGALVYVPYAVGIGYAISYGAGDTIHRLVGRIEPFVIAAIVLFTLALLVRRRCRPAHARW